MEVQSENKYSSNLEKLESYVNSGEVEITGDGLKVRLHDGSQSFEVIYDDGQLVSNSRFGPTISLGDYKTQQEAVTTMEKTLGIDLDMEDELEPKAWNPENQ